MARGAPTNRLIGRRTGEFFTIQAQSGDATLASFLGALAPGVAADGGIGRNIPTFFDVAEQRGAKWLMRAAFNTEDLSYYEKILLALNYAFANQNTDGSWTFNGSNPTVNGPAAAAFFLDSFACVYYGMRTSPMWTAYKRAFVNYLGPLQNAMAWLATQSSALSTNDSLAPNRLLFDASAFILNGQILGDSNLIATGNSLLVQALALQQTSGPIGAIFENGGYDSSYQSVSIMNLASLFYYTVSLNQAASLSSSINKAAVWELTRIVSGGYVLVAGNTRTNGTENNPSGSPKIISYKEVAFSLYLCGSIFSSPSTTSKGDDTATYLLNGLAVVPSNTVLPTITGTPQVGNTLIATPDPPGTWTNFPEGFTYQWNRSGTPITGATASTYVLVTSDAGSTMTVSVTAINQKGASASAATSAATAAVFQTGTLDFSQFGNSALLAALGIA